MKRQEARPQDLADIELLESFEEDGAPGDELSLDPICPASGANGTAPCEIPDLHGVHPARHTGFRPAWP